MPPTLDLLDLVPRDELTSFLWNLGHAINSRCAIVRYPNDEERRLLLEYSDYLRSSEADTPDSVTLDSMWQGLRRLGNGADYPAYGSCSFCTELRKSKLADLRCAYCNFANADVAYDRRNARLYDCHVGLLDMVAPIVLGDKHIADLFIGQNYQEVDEANLKRIHEAYDLPGEGVEWKAFLTAYQELAKNENLAEWSPGRPRLEGYRPLINELAKFLSNYATRRLADLLFSQLWTRVHVSQVLNELMAEVMRTLRDYVRYDTSGVWVENRMRSGWLTCLFSDYTEPDDQLFREGMRVHDGLGGEVMRTCNTVHWQTAAKIAEMPPPDEYKELRKKRELGTFLAVPLRTEGRVFGFLEVGAKSEYAFWPGTVAMLEEVARYVGLFLSLRNELARGFCERLPDPLRAGGLPSSAQHLVREIPDVIGCLSCTVFTLTDDHRFLQCEATTGIIGVSPTDDIGVVVRYPVDADSLTSFAFRNGTTIALKSRTALTSELKDRVSESPRYREAIRGSTGGVLEETECDLLPLIVAPIPTGGPYQGVMRVIGRAAGGTFSERDVALVERLATAIAYPETMRNSLVRVLRAAPALLSVLRSDLLYFYFLTLATHGDAIGLNRAILWDYDAADRSLRPVMAIGPADSEEAARMGSELSIASPSLESCLNNAEQGVKVAAASGLFRSIPPLLLIGEKSEARTLLESELDAPVVFADAAAGREVACWLPNLGIRSALCCVIPTNRVSRRFFLLCDNVYPGSSRSAGQEVLLTTVATIFHRGLLTLSREADFDALKSRAWRQAVDTIAHNLGNKLPFVEDGLLRAAGDPSRLHDRVFVSTLLERLRSSIRDVHDLRRMDLPVEATSPTRISELLNAIQRRLEDNNDALFRFNWDFAGYDDADLRVDLGRLLECFDILYRNVVDLKLDEPKLTIRVTTVRAELKEGRVVESSIGNKFLQIVVADNGQGIPLAKKTRIFEPYYSDKPSGEGLGLAFVAHVLRHHGGWIYEAGKPGHGAEFTLLIPISASSRKPATIPPPGIATSERGMPAFVPVLPRRAPSAPIGSTWRTLLVEDDEFVAWKIVERFRETKALGKEFEFAVVDSVADYLEMQKSCLFDVVILDISLFENWPERTRDEEGGLDIAEYLNVWNAGALVVVYSATLEIDTVVRAMRDGAYCCIDKSKSGSLAKLVDTVCSGVGANSETHAWLGEMTESLRQEFKDEYVALYEGKVLDHSKKLDDLKRLLRTTTPELRPYFVYVAEV